MSGVWVDYYKHSIITHSISGGAHKGETDSVTWLTRQCLWLPSATNCVETHVFTIQRVTSECSRSLGYCMCSVPIIACKLRIHYVSVCERGMPHTRKCTHTHTHTHTQREREIERTDHTVCTQLCAAINTHIERYSQAEVWRDIHLYKITQIQKALYVALCE